MKSLSKKSLVQIVLLSLTGIALCFNLTACGGDKSLPNVELIQDMMEQPPIKPQEYDESSPNHSGMRVPPEGTQPVGFTPYRYAKDFTASSQNKNPLAGDFSETTIGVGLKYYQTNCMICHGSHGEGGEKTSVGAKMALKPPSLHSEKIVKWSDGEIFHVITMGQGLMGPYAAHIPLQYRWQVVNYVRQLQKESK